MQGDQVLVDLDPPKAELGAVYPGRVVNVTKFASMLAEATENASPPPPRAVAAAARFARDPAEYRTRHIQLTLIEGGEASR